MVCPGNEIWILPSLADPPFHPGRSQRMVNRPPVDKMLSAQTQARSPWPSEVHTRPVLMRHEWPTLHREAQIRQA
jgi:hypothetical protein